MVLIGWHYNLPLLKSVLPGFIGMKVDNAIALGAFNLVNIVESQADLLIAKAREKQLSLMTYVDPALAFVVNGDPGRIGQVLLNLIGNSLKFTQKGSVVVRALNEV